MTNCLFLRGACPERSEGLRMTMPGFLTSTNYFHFQASLFLDFEHHLKSKISAKNGRGYESLPVMVGLSRQYFGTLLVQIRRCAAKTLINSSCPGYNRH